MENVEQVSDQAKEGYVQFDDNEEEDMLVSQLNMDISNQFVVFSVENEEYGIPILSVQEIISLPKLTRIPGVPDYISGMINLRGNIIPLYFLRTRFKLAEKKLDENSIVIITEIGNEKKRIVGFIVDTVSDVVSITEEDLSETPQFDSNVDAQFIEKIGKIGSRMIIIINLMKFFSENELQTLDKIVK